mmetsp:Transcript_114102/g.368614  ORF Transcript_114102/g.368614 Transcript_114102/m.368614 type:complete len:281 (-) Transcript_114102:142-984(-)
MLLGAGNSGIGGPLVIMPCNHGNSGHSIIVWPGHLRGSCWLSQSGLCAGALGHTAVPGVGRNSASRRTSPCCCGGRGPAVLGASAGAVLASPAGAVAAEPLSVLGMGGAAGNGPALSNRLSPGRPAGAKNEGTVFGGDCTEMVFNGDSNCRKVFLTFGTSRKLPPFLLQLASSSSASRRTVIVGACVGVCATQAGMYPTSVSVGIDSSTVGNRLGVFTGVCVAHAGSCVGRTFSLPARPGEERPTMGEKQFSSRILIGWRWRGRGELVQSSLPPRSFGER